MWFIFQSIGLIVYYYTWNLTVRYYHRDTLLYWLINEHVVLSLLPPLPYQAAQFVSLQTFLYLSILVWWTFEISRGTLFTKHWPPYTWLSHSSFLYSDFKRIFTYQPPPPPLTHVLVHFNVNKLWALRMNPH